jgi:glutathione S-transferase
MMILRNAPASPFGRKVRIAASLLGLADQIEIRTADPIDPNDDLREQNPVGKIPTLIGEDGEAYYDSRVIVEYLDHRAGGGLIIPRDGAPRFEALRLQSLCDGLLDASLLLVYEGRFRSPEHHEQKWTTHQAGKVERGA